MLVLSSFQRDFVLTDGIVAQFGWMIRIISESDKKDA